MVDYFYGNHCYLLFLCGFHFRLLRILCLILCLMFLYNLCCCRCLISLSDMGVPLCSRRCQGSKWSGDSIWCDSSVVAVQ